MIMQLMGVLLGFIALASVQVPKIIENKWWKDLIVYGVIYVLALAASVAYALNWPILSPLKIVTVLVNGMFHILGYKVPE